MVIFEGRDAAGKGGAIKAITERVSSRVLRVVALPAPSERQKPQLVIQRYCAREKVKLSTRQSSDGYVEPRWRRQVVPSVY